LSRGAIGSVLIPVRSGELGAWWRRARRDFAFEDLSLAYAVPSHLSLMLHPRLAAFLFAEALYNWGSVLEMAETGSLRSFHLPVRLRFEGRFRTRDALSPNVVARLRGGDLRDTAVVVSAHYDHLGVGPEVAGDAIYNGVVDNALGVAGVLEMARVLAAARRPPRRSVVLLLTTAEEQGLLGAQYFLDHPPLPVVDMVANVNVDGLAFSAGFSDLIGAGAELSTLGRTLAEVADELGLEVSSAPAEFWSSESFARSDQLAFAERGVPSLLINEGFQWRDRPPEAAIEATVRWLSTIYHSPADDLAQPIDWEAAAQHAGVITVLAQRLANSPNAPEWSPGVSYAYQRLLSRAMAD
jgi:Zn-dependent M28 family amino/carboxypeptidase